MEDSLRSLVPRNDGPFAVVQMRSLANTVIISRIHNVVSIDRIRLAKTPEKALQAPEVKHREEVPLVAGNTGEGHLLIRISRHKDD